MNKVSVQALNECFNVSGEDFILVDDSDYEPPKINQPWNKGKSGLYQHNEETIKIMSENQRGENNTFYGRTHSKKTKSIWKEQRKNEGNSFYGKTHTDEANRKITARHRKNYRFVSPSGQVFDRFTTIREFCREMEIYRQKFNKTWKIEVLGP